ncbi:hypothetical protein [Mesorhizobium sp. B4-1-1]|uniref:hypothetical protein n=1 Tax=Mesorhizobium sp. B4-1-1 TaxID=2589890 RepID=UPI00112B5618|nr:hypothetical protein [Mesorhizobium sp. B4-1-1]TPI18880.1 hypothetical protein FJW10_17335 [Mesorhizobium sp. B4-1-1]
MTQPSNERPPSEKAADLLALAAAFAQRCGLDLNDPALVERFLADAAPRLKGALADPTLLYGTRTERMFEATVLSLGRFRLFKTEDVGRVHAATTFRAPDFRVVLDDGGQWLVEVKNVHCEDPQKQRTTMSAAYLTSLQAYADAVGAPLRLALYWSRWNLWTIIAPDSFRRPAGGLRVTMIEAVMANEFARLGDVSIATKPPLRLVLDAATDQPRKLSTEGLAEFVVGSARVYSGDVELTDPRDRRLAEILLLYGEWQAAEPFAIMGDEGIAGVEFVVSPEEPSDQGFDRIGSASRIFTRHFATRTVDGDQVIQLNGAPVPEWFAPLAAWDFERSQLPLWLFYQQPVTAALEVSAHPDKEQDQRGSPSQDA